MKIQSAAQSFVLAACLLPLTGFTEDAPLREEMSTSTQTEPADEVIAYDQLPPTAAGPMRPEMSQEDPLDGCN